MGEISVIHVKALVYFYSFEALDDAFEVQFFRASFLHLTKDTDSM